MKDTLTGLLVYALFVLSGIACACHVTGYHTTACQVWAAVFVIVGTVTPIAIAWPARKVPRGTSPGQAQDRLPTSEEWMRANRGSTGQVQTNDSTAR